MTAFSTIPALSMNSRKRKRKGTRQGAPALPSERISGSAKNTEGSAASRSSASDITLTPEIVAALRRKVDDHNKSMRKRRAPDYRMASLPMLKAVMRRGMGAFSTSHRPNVSSRQQWGMARVNAFLRILSSGSPADPKYVSDNDLLPVGHERHSGTKSIPQRSTYCERVYSGIEVKVSFGSHLSAPYNPKARATTRRARRLASEPFDPHAIDGDGDKIVQEGTIWERPAGTHWVTAAGERIEEALPKMTSRKRGINRVQPGEAVAAHHYHPSMRLVDKHGNHVDYTPTWAGQRIGFRTRHLGPTLGAGIGENQPHAVDVQAAEARRIVSTPHRLARFTADVRKKMLDAFNRGLGPDRPGSRYSVEQATERLSWLLEHAKNSDAWRNGRHWYEQQHHAIRALAKRHDANFHVAVAVVAATSPRNPWDLPNKRDTPNLDIASYLLGNWSTMKHDKFELTDEFISTVERSLASSPQQLEEFQASLKRNPSRIRTIGSITASGNEPTKLDYTLAGIVMAARAYEAQDHNTTYLSKSVANALAIIDGGPEHIDENLSGPKVRSFFDNIAFFNESDAVTMDSIMGQLITGLNAEQVGELFKPDTGAQVTDRFGKKVAGYSFYAVASEVVHQVTERWNAKHPNDMLSITDVQAILWYIQREHPEMIDLLNKEKL